MHDDERIDVAALQTTFLMQGVGRTLTAPLDRVKYLLQAQGELHRLGKLERPYNSAIVCVRRILALEGPAAFWRGNIIQVVGTVPNVLGQMLVGVPVQRAAFDLLPHSTPTTFTAAAFLSGMIGATATTMVTYPFDFARFRLACDVKPHVGGRYDYRHTLALLSHPNIVESPHLAYRGLSLFLFGSVLYRGVYMTLLQLVTPFLPTDTSHGTLAVFGQGLAGFSIMAVSTLWMYPLDTVRRRMMLAVNHDEFEYRSINACIRTIARAEGLRGFYRGALFNTLRGGLTSAVALMVGLNM